MNLNVVLFSLGQGCEAYCLQQNTTIQGHWLRRVPRLGVRAAGEYRTLLF
jgi:hypothetical protein